MEDAYPHLHHVVVSRSLAGRDDLPVEIVSEDPLARIRELKQQAGSDLWLVGGGTVAHALLPEIDRLVLKVNPSVIGAGISLFAGTSRTRRSPSSTRSTWPGVRVVTLDRAG